MKLRFLILAALVFSLNLAANAQHVISLKDYQEQLKTDPEKRLVEIVKVVPGIRLDIRYATTNNFMHRKMYRQARAFARAPVAEALKKVQADLQTKGLGLKIYDAYRPYAVTVDFFKYTTDTNYVANPKYGSKHNRGCAVDLTLIDLKTGKELPMPTEFDSFNVKAGAYHTAGLTPEQIKNRELLKTVMQANGFTVLRSEWWHYDFTGWHDYELLDVPFEKVK